MVFVTMKMIMSKPVIKIGVVSDVVCPWCYIGKRRLERAINALGDKFDFDIAYYPFELDPEAPTNGRDQKEHLIKKFGSESQYDKLTGNVTRVAEAEGLTFDYNTQKVSPNTRNAHRLIQLAKDDGKQAELVEALFKAYFTDGIDLSKNENLIDVAVSAGLDKNKVEQFLESNTGVTEVVMAEQELQRLGISGVPFYIIEDKYGVSGAQPAETFIKAFEDIGKEITAGGEACNVDAKNC
jgi:predicted DsbA family dithiol-disulfide isomerase